MLVQVTVKLWDMKSGRLALEASSGRAAVEVGGGPWWEAWTSEAQMQEPLKSLVKLPIDVEAISSRLPQALQPRGL